MNKPLTSKEISAHANAVLRKMLDNQFKPTYKMKWVNGKYNIYKHDNGVSTTLAHSLDKETATGMMKLLENQDD